MTFKDLKAQLGKLQPSSESEESKILERLKNKPFWIWDQEEHRREDIKTKGECCWNHIVGLPRKDNQREYPMFD